MIFLNHKKEILIYPRLKSRIIFLFLITGSTSGAVVDYCFSHNQSLSTVHQHLKTVLSPQDEVILNESSHCLNVVMKNDYKEELYRKWILKKFSLVNSTRIHQSAMVSNAKPVAQKQHCRLEVERVSHLQRRTTKGSLSKQSVVNQTSIKSNGSQKSSLLLGIGSPGSLRVDDDYINVICKSRNASRVFLDISLTGRNSSVSTSLSIERGQKVNLASIVEDLNNKYKRLSLAQGLEVEETKGSKSFDYFLRIKD